MEPLKDLESVGVPNKKYFVSFEAALTAAPTITSLDVRRPDSTFGKIVMQIVPDFRITMKAVQDMFLLNKRNSYSAVADLGLSILQHKFNGDLSRIQSARKQNFYSGSKRLELRRYFGATTQFFPREAAGGARKQALLYGDSNQLISPISEYGEFFSLSASDMAHIVMSHAIVKWEDLPADYKEYFESINARFERHARLFYNTT